MKFHPFTSYRTKSVLRWVSKWIFHSLIPWSEVDYQLGKFSLWYDNNGPVYCAKRIKEIRLAVTRYWSGTPLTSSTLISLNKTGLPKCLSRTFKELVISRDPLKMSFVLTMLSLGRSIMGGTPVSLEAIETPSKFVMDESIEKQIIEFLQYLKVPEGEVPESSSFHWTTKAGPNGPALSTAVHELPHLPSWLKSAIRKLGGGLVASTMDILEPLPKSFYDILGQYMSVRQWSKTRKLSIKRDKEAKSRVFAILDYWSQAALKPLHDYIFFLLKTNHKLQRVDATFNQDAGFTKIPQGKTYYSFDLTSATDRLPLSFQEVVVTYLLGDKRFTQHWKDILVKEPFDLQGKPVYYKAGQPMGAYSSWAVFTLSHHAILYIASQRSGTLPLTDYIILGDDIVIWNKRLAEAYLDLLSQLDVPTSPAKSHISSEIFEFAKRWCYRGEEISPFPVHALLAIGPKYWLLWELVCQSTTKGFPSLKTQLTTKSWFDFFTIWGKQGRHRDQLTTLMRAQHFTPLPADSSVERGLKIRALLGLFGETLPCSMTPNSVNNEFTFLAMLSMTKSFRRDELKLTEKVTTVKRALFTLVDDLSNNIPKEDLHLVRVDITNHLPFIMAADKEISSVVKDWESFDSDSGPQDPWDKLSHVKMSIFPSFSGINPIRVADRYAGGRATYLRDIIKWWKSEIRSQEIELQTSKSEQHLQ